MARALRLKKKKRRKYAELTTTKSTTLVFRNEPILLWPEGNYGSREGQGGKGRKNGRKEINETKQGIRTALLKTVSTFTKNFKISN